MFSCEYFEMFKNSYLEEHLKTAAMVIFQNYFPKHLKEAALHFTIFQFCLFWFVIFSDFWFYVWDHFNMKSYKIHYCFLIDLFALFILTFWTR